MSEYELLPIPKGNIQVNIIQYLNFIRLCGFEIKLNLIFFLFFFCDIGNRAREWLDICERPDLVVRMASKEININNYYVCEIHFPKQILDYSTRKILLKTAKPLTLDELKKLPPRERNAKASLPMRIPKRRQTMNHGYRRNDFVDDTVDNDEDPFSNTTEPEIIVPKIEIDHDNDDLLEPLHIQDEESKCVTCVKAEKIEPNRPMKIAVFIQSQLSCRYDGRCIASIAMDGGSNTSANPSAR